MTIQELRQLYHDGTIKKKARSELKADFVKTFGYSTDQQFTMMMAPNSLELPTPKELDWLVENVQLYHKHYTDAQLSIMP